MVDPALILELKEDFSFILKNSAIFGVMLYGSYLTGDETNRSDIDICIVTPEQNLYQMHKYINHNLERHQDRYDIRFFEELPLYIQGNIIENGKVILSHDITELYEYFYPFRRQWVHEKWRIDYVA